MVIMMVQVPNQMPVAASSGLRDNITYLILDCVLNATLYSTMTRCVLAKSLKIALSQTSTGYVHGQRGQHIKIIPEIM
jgi:hypothetical protein